MKLVFATNNEHKLAEIRHAASAHISIAGLQEMGIQEEIPETRETLEENAIEKAMYIYKKYHFTCFADDTGLEVNALDNRPGVHSARYAGPACNFRDNIDKLIGEMEGVTNREACFRTVIAYVNAGKVSVFEGKIKGMITKEMRGNGGFGYDPVFEPDGYSQTFAEMPLELKNSISHRALALHKFLDFLDLPDK